MNLYKLMGIPFIGNRLMKKIILKLENGEMYSDSLRKYTKNKHKVEIGKYSYGGCFEDTFNYAHAGEVIIGRYCSFGMNCHYFGANHPVERFSTSPIFYRKKFGFDVQDVERFELVIGNDVWFGYGVLVTSSCHMIGNGAVVAAGSVVTKDVPPYAIVAGTPAKILKYRFDSETMESIEKSKWYLLDPEQIIEFHDYMKFPKEISKKIIERYRL